MSNWEKDELSTEARILMRLDILDAQILAQITLNELIVAKLQELQEVILER